MLEKQTKNEELKKQVSFNEIRYNKDFKKYVDKELGPLPSNWKNEIQGRVYYNRLGLIKRRTLKSKAFNEQYYELIEDPNDPEIIKIKHKKDHNIVPITERHEHKGVYSFKDNIHTFVEEKENGEKEKTDFILMSVMRNPFIDDEKHTKDQMSLSLIYNNKYTQHNHNSQLNTYGFNRLLFGKIYDIPKDEFMAFKFNAETRVNLEKFDDYGFDAYRDDYNFLISKHPYYSSGSQISIFNKNCRKSYDKNKDSYDKNKNLEYLLEFLCKMIKSNEKYLNLYKEKSNLLKDCMCKVFNGQTINLRSNEIVVDNFKKKEKEIGYCCVLATPSTKNLSLKEIEEFKNSYKLQLNNLLTFIKDKKINSDYKIIVIDNRIGQGKFYSDTIINAFNSLKENLTTNYSNIINDKEMKNILKEIETTIIKNTPINDDIDYEKEIEKEIKANYNSIKNYPLTEEIKKNIRNNFLNKFKNKSTIINKKNNILKTMNKKTIQRTYI